jgi:hypothetical protein
MLWGKMWGWAHSADANLIWRAHFLGIATVAVRSIWPICSPIYPDYAVLLVLIFAYYFLLGYLLLQLDHGGHWRVGQCRQTWVRGLSSFISIVAVRAVSSAFGRSNGSLPVLASRS